VSRVLQYIKQGVYFCSHLLQRCFLRWTQPPRSSLLLGTGMDLTRGKAELVAENAFLRQQLIMLRRQIKRPTYRKSDRILLVLLARAVRAWKQALLIVQPETLLRWHRQGLRLFLEAQIKAEVHTSEGGSRDHRVDQRDGKHQSTSSEQNGSVANCSSWAFACANARSRSICDRCTRLAQKGKTGEHFCAIMRERFGLVISSKSPACSSVRSLRSSSLNCNRGRSSMWV
jgi:hypothetical protein